MLQLQLSHQVFPSLSAMHSHPSVPRERRYWKTGSHSSIGSGDLQDHNMVGQAHLARRKLF
uniref:Putative ovule protein n=1 Tax=Solanum chacoense TaxID=4108 RepID=A0A0V0GNR5_SOLCH